MIAVRSPRFPQRMQCFLERGDFLERQPAARVVRLQQDVLDAARRAPGSGKADGRTDADDAVDPPVVFRDRLAHRLALAREVGDGGEGVLDLAFERRNEALAYPGKTLGECIDGHDGGPPGLRRREVYMAQVNIFWTD